jgi:endo-1,4-beta-xylanase
VGDLPVSGTLVLPGGASGAVADISAAALAMAAADDPDATLVSRNPIASLGLALAAADWSGQSGAVDLSALLPKLPLTPVRLVLSSLPGGSATDTLDSVAPQGLTLHQGAALLLAGAMPDGRIALAISDPARQVAAHPRLELAILSPSTLAPLLVLASASLDPSGAAVTVSGKSIPLARIDPALATRLVSGAGVLFVDQVPLQPKGASTPVLTVDPIVPVPDPGVVTGAASVGRSADGRILALDSSGTAVGRAAFLDPQWQWVGPDKAAGLDYFLRELAEGAGIHLGVAPDGAQFSNKNTQYLALIGEYFNLYENDMGGWQDRNPAPGQFNFGWADEVIAFAPAHSMRTLSYLVGTPPSWALGANYSTQQLAAFTKDWITTVVGRYRGVIDTWVVFNEAISGTLYGSTPPEHFWANSFGSDFWPFIAQTFAWARAADPRSALILNDHENDGRNQPVSDGCYELVKYLLSQKTPIDGVGMEMHLAYIDPGISGPWSPQVFIDWVKKYQALGLQVFVTEFDVNMTGFKGTKAEEETWQATQYHDYLQAALDAGIDNFTIFGLTDSTSWYTVTNRPHADALMLNGDYTPKPAYFAVRDVLKKRAGLA